MFPVLDLYHRDPAQHLRTAGHDLDDLDHDLSARALSVLTIISPKSQLLQHKVYEGAVVVKGEYLPFSPPGTCLGFVPQRVNFSVSTACRFSSNFAQLTLSCAFSNQKRWLRRGSNPRTAASRGDTAVYHTAYRLDYPTNSNKICKHMHSPKLPRKYSLQYVFSRIPLRLICSSHTLNAISTRTERLRRLL